MKRNLKRKNYNLDEKKDPPREDDPGCDDQTEAIDAALNLVVFREEILKSLEKVAGKGGVEKVFLVAKHLIDTDLYIDLIQSGTTLPFIHEIYYNDAPGIYFSSIVAQELLGGARKACGDIIPSLRESRRVATNNHNHWKDAGGTLAKVLHDRPDLKDKLPALVNDCLLALSARSLGATLCTRNRDDFTLIQSRRSFSLIAIS